MQAPSSYFDPLSPASPACAPPTTDIPPRGVSHAAVISPGAPVLPPLPPAAPPSLPGMVIPPMPGASNGAPLTPGPQSTTYNPPMPYNPPAPPPTMSSAPNPSQTTTSNSNQTMEPFRSNWLALLDNQLATDTVLVCGPEATEIPCHRAVLISQSAYFRSKLSGDTLPPRIELPDIQAGAVKLFLRFIYSGLPAAMDCLSDPVLAVDVLHAIEELAASEPDLTRWRAARRAIEGQLIELMGSENAGKGLARLNRYGMRGTFEACLPLYMQAAKNDPTRTVGLLEGMDYGAFLHAVKSADWPGGDMQKFRICRAWAEVNRASSEQKMELAKLIDLERITLDDLEKEVEVSGRDERRVKVADEPFPLAALGTHSDSETNEAVHGRGETHQGPGRTAGRLASLAEAADSWNLGIGTRNASGCPDSTTTTSAAATTNPATANADADAQCFNAGDANDASAWFYASPPTATIRHWTQRTTNAASAGLDDDAAAPAAVYNAAADQRTIEQWPADESGSARKRHNGCCWEQRGCYEFLAAWHGDLGDASVKRCRAASNDFGLADPTGTRACSSTTTASQHLFPTLPPNSRSTTRGSSHGARSTSPAINSRRRYLCRLRILARSAARYHLFPLPPRLPLRFHPFLSFRCRLDKRTMEMGHHD